MNSETMSLEKEQQVNPQGAPSHSKKIMDEVRSYLFITVGLLFYCFAATALTVPLKVVGGGATGLSTVIYYLSGERIPVGVGFFLVNSVLLVVALKILGPKFGIKTVYAIIVSSCILAIMQPFFPEAIVSDKFMGTVIAGMLTGVGVSIALSHGGSTGGTDIVAMIWTKYKNVSPGKVLMFADFTVIATTLLISFNLEALMYGYVMMGVVSFTVDFILTGKKQSVQLFIFSDNYEMVADTITKELHRGVTAVDCQGWYTKQGRKMLVVIARKNEATEILKTIKRVDPKAFMTMNTVMGVFGEGFDEIKG
ncbi:MAG: YitT family protein [Marinifilaceae bacterium]